MSVRAVLNSCAFKKKIFFYLYRGFSPIVGGYDTYPPGVHCILKNYAYTCEHPGVPNKVASGDIHRSVLPQSWLAITFISLACSVSAAPHLLYV